jgi:sec-independent protein translocase protein TatA
MGIGFRELLIILVIALILFGAKKLRHVGSDLGAAVRGFKKAVNEGEEETNKQIKDLAGNDADFGEHADAAKSDSKTSV